MSFAMDEGHVECRSEKIAIIQLLVRSAAG
jgi:hypothetical protein